MMPLTRFTSPLCFEALYEGDTVWFVLNTHYLIYTPPGAIVYTLAEAQRAARLPPSTRRIIHEAKRHSARITNTS
jgi:hypothetical protein